MFLFRSASSRFVLILALAALGAGMCALLLPLELHSVQQQLIGFPDSDVQAHQARPLVLGVLCFLPALASLFYACGGVLDRYIARQFVAAFGICLAALYLIFLLIDLTDKISDFRGAKHVLHTLGVFYGTRLPPVLLMLLPYSLLLALLHTLNKLSTTRELIAIVQAGRGVIRIARPLMVAGGFCALLALGLNFHWAPIADGTQDEILAEASDKPATKASQVLYRNRENRRLWMIGSFPSDYQKGTPLVNIEVTTTDENHVLLSRLFASHARWDLTTHRWTFDNPVISRYTPGRPPAFDQLQGPLTIDSWSETPWQLIKPGLSAAYLGIPDLNGWLAANARHQPFAAPAPYLTQWHYRLALPLSCLVTVLFATPLAIHFSRRGSGSGIFFAVLLSALMLLVSSIMLALGEAGTINPALAAWLPNLAFALLGLELFHRRITGRTCYQWLKRKAES